MTTVDKNKTNPAPPIRLAAFGKKRLNATRRWVNDPEVRHFIGTLFPVGPAEHEAWGEALLKNPNMKFFAILSSDGRHIGNAGVYLFDRETDIARLFVYIGDPEYRDRGYGAGINRMVCDYCFRKMRVHRVEATVFSFNPRASGAYRKAGFQLEARMIDAAYHRGRYHDMLLFGLLKSEWSASQ